MPTGALRRRPAETGDWDDLRFVLALHRHGSVAAAARALGVNEITVSRRLKSFESALDTQLFERERGRVSATEEAEGLIERLVAIGDELSIVCDELQGIRTDPVGAVRVTGVSVLVNRVVTPALPTLLSAYPGIEVEPIVDTATLGITYQREADVAVRLYRPRAEQGAVTRKIGDVRCGVYCHRELDPSDAEMPWVTYGRRSASLPHAIWIEEQRLGEKGRVSVRADDAEALLQCVRAGLGKTLLPDAYAALVPDLVRLPGDAVPDREMWLLVHPSWREVRRIEIVATWLHATLGEFLEQTSA